MAALALVLWAAPAAADDEADDGDDVPGADDGEARPAAWTTRISLEAGTEYDSNIHRLEVPDGSPIEIEGAPLMRGAARASTRIRLGSRGQVRGRGLAAGKIFFADDTSENVGLWSLDVRYDRALASRRAVTSLRAAGYESYALAGGDTMAGRNFATRLTELGLLVPGPEHHRVGAVAGVRDFQYKSDADFDWTGDHYGLYYQTAIWRGDPDVDLDAASIDIDVRYQLGRRLYAGKAYSNNCAVDMEPEPTCIVPTSFDRSDLYHQLRVASSYTGDRAWSAAYELSLADSNSFGQSLLRHRLELGLTTEVVANVFASARATVTLNTFLDPLLLARDVNAQTFVTIDDENRNSFSLHLARDVGASWTAEARYAIYTNEFATRELSFRRHIGYLGLAYRY